MHAKKEAALADAAATMSDELDETRFNLRAAQNADNHILRAGECPGITETRRGGASPRDIDSTNDQSDDPNARISETPVDLILARLGRAVLLPIQPGKKYPTLVGWQKITQNAMNDPAYVAKLNAGGNIGVLLGAASDGLCTIDLDHDEEVECFLALNPRLRFALRTRRSRGGNIWMRIEGEYPPLTKLKTKSGNPWGEWRTDKGQTVIHGAACDPAQGETKPIEYKVVQEGQPVRLRFEEILWPSHLSLPWAKGVSVTAEPHDAPTPGSDYHDDHIIVLFGGGQRHYS